LATPPNQVSRLDSLAFCPFLFCPHCQLLPILQDQANASECQADNCALVPYNGNRAYKYYLDGYKVNGKRKRLFFKDEAAANRKLAMLDLWAARQAEIVRAIGMER
jgi:hypothetical protein